MRLTIKIKPDGDYIASGRSREGVQIAYIVGWAMRAAREIVKEEDKIGGEKCEERKLKN